MGLGIFGLDVFIEIQNDFFGGEVRLEVFRRSKEQLRGFCILFTARWRDHIGATKEQHAEEEG